MRVATTVYLALGSNVGDRQQHLTRALRRLAELPGTELLQSSSWHESQLQGAGPPQGAFLNGAAKLRTSLAPHALLALLKELEAEAGRVLPAPPNHPRPLDLDIVFYGDQTIDTRTLVVPHPRWHEREFVCRPLAELGLDVGELPRWRRPRVVHEAEELSAVVAAWGAGDCTVGLVPTMGSLHDGHASLMRRASAECDRVVATVFVNPLQFGPGEDFAAYPRDLDGDLAVCAAAGVDVLFAPSVGQMYPEGFASHVAVGREAEDLEGALRPGHFAGVATVVARLFAISRPQRAYFGEKDAQQLAVIRRMNRDLGFPLEVVPCAIVREADGLAMSSRNVYLGAEDRRASTVLYRAMRSAREQFRRGLRDRDALLARVHAVLASEPRAEVDYVALRREGDLAPLPPGDVEAGRLLVAARFRDGVRPVRLLDNLSLVEGPQFGDGLARAGGA